MEKIKEYKGIIIIVLILILGAFYWFQLRPTQIKKGCWNQIEKIKSGEIKSEKYNMEEGLIRNGVQNNIDAFYSNCLREHGLDK